MSIVVIGRVPSQGAYEGVTSRVMQGDQMPDGCQVHIASPDGGEMRVITVWDSEESWNEFREQKLVPAIQEVTGGAVEGPGAEVQRVHKFLAA